MDAGNENRAAARLSSLKWHLLGYFLVMAGLVAVNLLATPETLWFVWPMVGWGPMLAIHTAWVMGLFDILGPKS